MTTTVPSCEVALRVEADATSHPTPRPRRSIAPTSSRRRATPSESPQASAATLTAEILNGCAAQAANTFADARRLALRLHHAELRDDARLALDVAMALNEIAHDAHRAAELAAGLAASEGEVALW